MSYRVEEALSSREEKVQRQGVVYRLTAAKTSTGSKVVYLTKISPEGKTEQYVIAEGPVAEKIGNAIADAIRLVALLGGLALLAVGVGFGCYLANLGKKGETNCLNSG